MHATPTISLYAFAMLLVGLGVPGLALWALFRIVFPQVSRDDSASWNVDPSSDEEWPAMSAASASSAMPPPPPRDEHEYFLAADYAIEHDLPLPPPPPRVEHEEW